MNKISYDDATKALEGHTIIIASDSSAKKRLVASWRWEHNAFVYNLLVVNVPIIEDTLELDNAVDEYNSIITNGTL